MVIVAVPTVLSIASIRVYTVKEAPTDGLVPREKLNIYTPLPQTTQAQFVPERTGVIQSGLTRARESVLPFYQAVKGACVSFKRGSVNLYHTGVDVFYYLKDPPPEFLPRFGTITMAGLFGMFLTRKGSRFQRLAVPLSLMTAGATVCYPAQSVAVLKVTSKKVYAAGQWSSAAVSSLLSPKPVAKETVTSQPQGGTVPNPEAAAVKKTSEASSAQSSTIPETEVELAESVSVSDEPVAAVTSSVTLAEVSPEQTPTETNTDPVLTSVPLEPKTTSASGDVSVPVESEESSDTKQAVNNISSQAESTPNLEPDTVAAVPVEAASGPVVDSADPEPAPQPESSDPPQVAAVEETPMLTLTPTPSPQQPAADHSKDGSGFKADPALMDFGQANPEDEDLYSTRS